MTQGREWKLILLFTLPLMAGNFLQQIYSLTDGLVVGNVVGDTALSAVGVVFPVTFLLLAVAMGLSNGCGVLVAQFFGAKDFSNLRRSIATSIWTMLGAGLVMTAVGFALSRPLLVGVLNTPDNVLPLAMDYMKIYCLGLIFQFAYNAFAAILRALGNSRSTLYFLIVATVLNVVLDVVLAPDFGVAGVAWATVIAQGASALCAGAYLFRTVSILKEGKEELRFTPGLFRLAMRIGIPTCVQQCCVGLGMILMQRLINSFGQASMAATTAAMRVESFANVPIMMFYQGLANFTGQNMGAGKIDRVHRGYRQTLLMAMICCGLIIAVILVFCRQIVGCFGLDAEAQELGASYLRTLMVFFVIFCLMYVTNGVLQGSGDALFPTIGSMSSLGVRVICANLMAAFTSLGYASIYLSIPIGWVVGTTIVFCRFLTRRWEKKVLVKQKSEPNEV
jgi:putative MATE family efflux protein